MIVWCITIEWRNSFLSQDALTFPRSSSIFIFHNKMQFQDNLINQRSALRRYVLNSSSPQLVSGQRWCLVSMDWIRAWKRYVDFDNMESHKVWYVFIFNATSRFIICPPSSSKESTRVRSTTRPSHLRKKGCSSLASWRAPTTSSSPTKRIHSHSILISFTFSLLPDTFPLLLDTKPCSAGILEAGRTSPDLLWKFLKGLIKFRITYKLICKKKQHHVI